MGYPFRRMTRFWRRLTAVLAIGLAVPLPAAAQRRAAAPSVASADEASAEDQEKAQEHFQRAKDLYQSGSYREAIAELEAARALDPRAKELVFNLGIVHEKLGQFDDAIAAFQKYLEMEGVTAQERAKAESVITRIEGAKREIAAGESQGPPPAPPPPVAEPAPPPDRDAAPARGRIDAATIAAGSVAIVGLGVGTAFGIRALTLRPDGFVTGRDGTYATLEDRTRAAHTSAVVADVALAVFAVSAVATAYLYFGRTKEPRGGTTTLGASPTHGGGVVVLGGSFR
jgi:tetratricopeptide (TPR) repeat protein